VCKLIGLMCVNGLMLLLMVMVMMMVMRMMMMVVTVTVHAPVCRILPAR